MSRSQHATLDAAAALARVGGDRAFLVELLHLAIGDLLSAAADLCGVSDAVRAGGGDALAQAKALRRAGHAAKGCAATVELRAGAAAAEALLAAVRPLDDGAVGAAVRTAALRRLAVAPAAQARELLACVREAAALVQRDPAWRCADAPQRDGADAIDELVRARPWLGGSSGGDSGGSPGAALGDGQLVTPPPPPPLPPPLALRPQPSTPIPEAPQPPTPPSSAQARAGVLCGGCGCSLC